MHPFITRYAFLLGALLACQPAGASATFAFEDRTTQGNWINAYGIPSFYAPGLVATNWPATTRVTTAGAAYQLWAAQTNLAGALLKPLTPDATELTALDRHAAAWTASGGFSILIERASTSRRLAIYCLDFGSGGTRSQTVSLVDTNTGAVIEDSRTGQPCTATISGFTNGVYLVWDTIGTVRVDVTRLTGPDAAVSALFLNNPTTVSTNAPTVDQESVWVAPDLYYNSLGIAANEGDTFALGARSMGTPPLAFRWYRDGVLVPGATSPTLTFPNVAADRAGDYTLMVSNAHGTVTSRSFTVDVFNPWSHHAAFGWLYDNRNDWYANPTLGWLWFSGDWAWSSRLNGWVASIGTSTTLWSTQFRWLQIAGIEAGFAHTSTLGLVWIAEDGWVWNSRFGWTWAVGDGIWFWSSNLGWIGITADGGIWSVTEGRFI
jgi:hypothetical protein